MKIGNGEKGLFARLNANKKEKKRSVCCNIEIEEIPDKGENKKVKKNSCCSFELEEIVVDESEIDKDR